jgi:hypothetical protein
VSICGYNTTATVFDGIDSPEELIAFTLYSALHGKLEPGFAFSFPATLKNYAEVNAEAGSPKSSIDAKRHPRQLAQRQSKNFIKIYFFPLTFAFPVL